MNKVIAVSILVLVATIGLSAYAYTVYLPSLTGTSSGSGTSSLAGPGTGTMNFYLTDAPAHNATLKYLLINVTSVTLKYSSNLTQSTTTTSSASSSSSTATGASTESTGTSSSSTSSSTNESSFVPRYVFNVPPSVGTNVNLTKLQGPGILLGTAKVPAGNVTGVILNITGAEAFWTDGSHAQLKVVADGKLMINIHFTVQSNGTTNLTLDITPGDIHVSPGQASVLRPVVLATAVSSGPNGTHTTETTETETESSSTS